MVKSRCLKCLIWKTPCLLLWCNRIANLIIQIQKLDCSSILDFHYVQFSVKIDFCKKNYIHENPEYRESQFYWLLPSATYLFLYYFNIGSFQVNCFSYRRYLVLIGFRNCVSQQPFIQNKSFVLSSYSNFQTTLKFTAKIRSMNLWSQVVTIVNYNSVSKYVTIQN